MSSAQESMIVNRPATSTRPNRPLDDVEFNLGTTTIAPLGDDETTGGPYVVDAGAVTNRPEHRRSTWTTRTEGRCRRGVPGAHRPEIEQVRSNRIRTRERQ